MALRIEIHKPILQNALNAAIASCKRAINTSKRPEFTVVYEKEIAELQNGLNTISEIK